MHVSVCVCVCVCVSESQEDSVDSPDSCVTGSIPEISVTGVGGERLVNGEALRSRTEGEALGGATEVGVDPRGQEVRRQTSVRKHLEDGTPSVGRVQF